jgi:hypothetical protein
MTSFSSGEIALTIGFVFFGLSILYATWPRNRSKDLEHALNSFRAQQETILAMKKRIDEHSVLSLSAQENAYAKFQSDLDSLKDLYKKIEWLEIKVNAKSEVAKYALPSEMRVIIENRTFVKKPQPAGATSKDVPDYMARG